MTSGMFDRTPMECLRALVELCIALLLLEIAAGVLFWIEDHLRGRRGWKYAGVKLLRCKQRLDKAAVGENPAMREREEVITLSVVGCDWLRVEGVDIGVVGVLWIEGQNSGQPLAG